MRYNLESKIVGVPRKQLNVYVPVEQVARLSRCSAKTRFPVSQLVVVAVEEFFERHGETLELG